MKFHPPFWLRSAHAQTVLASRLTRRQHLTTPEFESNAQNLTLTCTNSVRLQALVNVGYQDAPLVILLHGWLGDNQSSYVRRTAALLHAKGYNVARLNFRDHGGTAHLNADMFHSARLAEVLEACNALCSNYAPANTGNNGSAIVGFSLGGNFALRLAGATELHHQIRHCIAICPAVNPTTAAVAIDGGWRGYQWYFVQRWQKALAAKAAAFPERYDLTETRTMRRVDTITEYFVRHYTQFASVADYYTAYQVTPTIIANAKPSISILAAADDPVIPVQDIRELATASQLHYIETPRGGHCGFITDSTGTSPVPRWVVERLQATANNTAKATDAAPMTTPTC